MCMYFKWENLIKSFQFQSIQLSTFILLLQRFDQFTPQPSSDTQIYKKKGKNIIKKKKIVTENKLLINWSGG